MSASPVPDRSHLRLVPQPAGTVPLRVLVVGGGFEAGGVVQSWLATQGAASVQIGEKRVPYEWLDQYAASFGLVLADAGQLGGAGAMVDFGLRLRRLAPALPVIMASSRAGEDDLTSERMAFCDATLKKPFTLSRLDRAVAHAVENHARWLDQREALGPPTRLLGAIP